MCLSSRQCYLFSKRQPVPLEVEHLFLDTMETLRPGLVLLPSAQEAYQAALELERKFKDKLGGFYCMDACVLLIHGYNRPFSAMMSWGEK